MAFFLGHQQIAKLRANHALLLVRAKFLQEEAKLLQELDEAIIALDQDPSSIRYANDVKRIASFSTLTASEAYAATLHLLSRFGNVPALKVLVPSVGRIRYGFATGGTISIHDETAIQNDIDARIADVELR